VEEKDGEGKNGNVYLLWEGGLFPSRREDASILQPITGLPCYKGRVKKGEKREWETSYPKTAVEKATSRYHLKFLTPHGGEYPKSLGGEEKGKEGEEKKPATRNNEGGGNY